MKKLVSAVPIAAILGILSFLFVFMCLPQRQSAADIVFTIDLYFLRTRGLYCAVMGGIFMAAFYHLTLYIFRRHDTVYLIFSIMCLAGFVCFLFASNGFNGYFSWIPEGTFLVRLRGLLFFLYHYSIAILGLHVFSPRYLLTRRKTLAAYLAFGIAYLCLMPANFPFYWPVAVLFIYVACMFITVIALKSPVLRENRWTWLYFVSFIFYILIASINQVLIPGVLFNPGLLSTLFMILSQSLMLSKNYTNAFQFVEETNANLEQLVDERTKNLKAANEAMQATNIAMRELVSNISHDLKTPLAIMSINLETLSGLAVTQSDAEYQRHVRTAYQKNRDLQRLIQNLFEISRIEAGRNLYSPKWESVLYILAQVKEKYDSFLEDNGISFDITVEDDIEISTDPQKIWSVFDNIIYNAARHTESGGSITITAHNMESAATVMITDTGCGVEPEHLPHIFERFYQASQARGTNDGESGLGLYIVKSIMEGCGGSVEMQSESGKGTSVILTFPARRIETRSLQ